MFRAPVPYMVENIVRKGEIVCYKQFLLFSQCFPQLYIFSASKCGIVWQWVNSSSFSNLRVAWLFLRFQSYFFRCSLLLFVSLVTILTNLGMFWMLLHLVTPITFVPGFFFVSVQKNAIRFMYFSFDEYLIYDIPVMLQYLQNHLFEFY